MLSRSFFPVLLFCLFAFPAFAKTYTDLCAPEDKTACACIDTYMQEQTSSDEYRQFVAFTEKADAGQMSGEELLFSVMTGAIVNEKVTRSFFTAVDQCSNLSPEDRIKRDALQKTTALHLLVIQIKMLFADQDSYAGLSEKTLKEMGMIDPDDWDEISVAPFTQNKPDDYFTVVVRLSPDVCRRVYQDIQDADFVSKSLCDQGVLGVVAQ